MKLQQIIDYISSKVRTPSDDADVALRIEADDALVFLEKSLDGEVPILILGPCTYVASVLVSADSPAGDYLDDLLSWNFAPHEGNASLGHSLGKPALLRRFTSTGTVVLENAKPVTFHRRFYGYSKGRESYTEIRQDLAGC